MTGKNKESEILAKGDKEMWNVRIDHKDTFFSNFKNPCVIDLPGYNYDLEQHNRERELLKSFFDVENEDEKHKILKQYNEHAFAHHRDVKERFLEADFVIPNFDANIKKSGLLKIYFEDNNKNKELLYQRKVIPEKKPDIRVFNYKDLLTALVFYIKNPWRELISRKPSWESLKVAIPNKSGKLTIEFESNDDTKYLFLGTPRIYSKILESKNKHLNVVYLIFINIELMHYILVFNHFF